MKQVQFLELENYPVNFYANFYPDSSSEANSGCSHRLEAQSHYELRLLSFD